MKKKYIDKSRNKIKVLDWKKYRPEGFNSVSDSYYVKLSSKIYKELLSLSPDTEVWTKECIREISIISSSNIMVKKILKFFLLSLNLLFFRFLKLYL